MALDGKKTKVQAEKEITPQNSMQMSEDEDEEAQDPTYQTGSEVDEVTIFNKRCWSFSISSITALISTCA